MFFQRAISDIVATLVDAADYELVAVEAKHNRSHVNLARWRDRCYSRQPLTLYIGALTVSECHPPLG